MLDKKENEIMEDSLNIVANIPLTVKHFHKEISIHDKTINTLTKRLNRRYKKNLKGFDHKTHKLEHKIRKALKCKLNASTLLQQAINTAKNAIQNKIYPIKDELGLDIEMYVVEPTLKTPDLDSDLLYCICSEKSHGNMICCDNTNCKIGWFHFACVGLSTAPKGKWFCNECKKNKINKSRR